MNILYRCFATALAILAFGGVKAIAEDAPSHLPTLDEFLERTDFFSPELSPNGNRLAGVHRLDDDYYILSFDLQNGGKPKGTAVGDLRINWLDWANDDRLMFSVTGFYDYRTGKQMSFQRIKDGKGFPIPFTRLGAINADGTNQTWMFEDSRQMQRNLYLGGVVDFLRNDPNHILMAARMGGDLDLFRVNVNDGSSERVALGTGRTYAWYTDRKGEPAFRFNTNSRGTVIYIFAREDRENGKIKWKKIRTIRLNRQKNRDDGLEFEPLSPGPTDTTYYVAARPDGQDTKGIYLFDFEKDELVQAVDIRDGVDLRYGLFDDKTREYLGTRYFDKRLVNALKDETLQAHLDGLDTYFGNEMNVYPIQSVRGGKRWLVLAQGPRDPGSYHLYDVDDANAVELGSRRIDLSKRILAKTEVIEYTARDGLELWGYLTRPANAKAGAPAPLIVMPHGGPEMRDIYGFDQEAQIYAANGYQVFQPNFRGSSGFGEAFAEMGYGQWGRAMQTDIEDGFAHLVSEGLALDDKACIVGSSYGGYAALVAATQTPDLYQCAVSFAGVSDLITQLKFDRKEEGSNSEAYKYLLKQIGNPKTEKDTLIKYSPAQNAAKVTRPILLLHGESDSVVPIQQSELMDKRLRAAGKTVRFVELEDTSHSRFSDGELERYYKEVLDFLGEHLPHNSIPAEAVFGSESESEADPVAGAVAAPENAAVAELPVPQP